MRRGLGVAFAIQIPSSDLFPPTQRSSIRFSPQRMRVTDNLQEQSNGLCAWRWRLLMFSNNDHAFGRAILVTSCMRSGMVTCRPAKVASPRVIPFTLQPTAS